VWLLCFTICVLLNKNAVKTTATKNGL